MYMFAECCRPRLPRQSPAALLLRGWTIATRCCPAHPLPRSTNSSGPKTFWLAWFSRAQAIKVSFQCQASATPIALAVSERAHFIQGGAPHVQGAHHVVAKLPAAPPCANQVAEVLRRTPTACSANPDQHRQAGFQRHCTINVERPTKLRSPK